MRFLSSVLAILVSVSWLSAAPAPAELNIVIVEGEGATNNIRQRTAREPIVQVEDENHKPVAGVAVVFTLPSQGAGGVFADGSHTLTAVTNDQGQAVARGFRPNGVKGQYQIRVNASLGGVTASASINQTNAVAAGAAGTAGAAAGISGKLIAVIAIVGAAAAGGAVYATHSGGGGAAATIPAATTISAGSGSVGPPR